jgi:hypothetical protein
MGRDCALSLISRNVVASPRLLIAAQNNEFLMFSTDGATLTTLRDSALSI